MRVLGGKRVLDGVDLRVPAPGRGSGSSAEAAPGKSTLLSLVAGLDEPDAGTISVGGETSAAGSLARCALMPQRDCLLPWRTALDNACLALENRGVPRREARRRAAPLFARLGLAGAEQLRPAKLSGGMRQRVAFLRTLLADKDGAAARRAVRRTRRDHARGAAGVAARRARGRAADGRCSSPTTSRRRCSSATACSCSPTAAIVAELDVDVPRDAPRREIVIARAFVELRERALEAIG